jgi:hypothetical protein
VRSTYHFGQLLLTVTSAKTKVGISTDESPIHLAVTHVTLLLLLAQVITVSTLMTFLAVVVCLWTRCSWGQAVGEGVNNMNTDINKRGASISATEQAFGGNERCCQTHLESTNLTQISKPYCTTHYGELSRWGSFY